MPSLGAEQRHWHSNVICRNLVNKTPILQTNTQSVSMISCRCTRVETIIRNTPWVIPDWSAKDQQIGWWTGHGQSTIHGKVYSKCELCHPMTWFCLCCPSVCTLSWCLASAMRACVLHPKSLSVCRRPTLKRLASSDASTRNNRDLSYVKPLI